MATGRRCAAVVVLALLAGGGARAAQVRRDPLNEAEADQVRNAAGRPEQRLKLLLGFAQERLTRFDKVRADNLPDRISTLYGLLEDYSGILDEVGSNVDEMMSGRTTSESPTGALKVQKPLNASLEQERALFASLQKIQTSSSPADLGGYRFQLQDALDVTQQAIKDAEEDLVEAARREAAAKAEKAAAKSRAQQEKQEKKEKKHAAASPLL